MSTAVLKKARFRIENWKGDVKVCIGVQFSDDGITWGTAAYYTTDGTPNYTVAWNSADNVFYLDEVDFIDDFAINTTTRPTEKLFVRIGIWAANISNAIIASSQVRISLTGEDVSAGTATSDPFPVITGGTTTSVFVPMLAPMMTTGVANVRPSFELGSQSSGSAVVQVLPAYQTSNDGITWNSATDIGSGWTSTDGPTYGTSYTAISVSGYRFVRFGLKAKNVNTGSSTKNMAVATLRIDWRAS